MVEKLRLEVDVETKLLSLLGDSAQSKVNCFIFSHGTSLKYKIFVYKEWGNCLEFNGVLDRSENICIDQLVMGILFEVRGE